MLKWTKIKLVLHVAPAYTKVWSKNWKKIIYLEILWIDARMTLEWILNWVEDSELYSFGSGQGPVIFSCEDDDYSSISIKVGEFHE